MSDWVDDVEGKEEWEDESEKERDRFVWMRMCLLFYYVIIFTGGTAWGCWA